jgi:CheY-like chemotaxis protein
VTIQLSYFEASKRGEARVPRSNVDRRRLGGIGRPKVLLAEDHDDTRDALSMLLELQGYEVLAAKDGEEALQVALQVAPDVVITDYDMPKLDGAGLARQLRSLSHPVGNIPILVLTALNQSMVAQAMEAGADAYVSKPVDFQTLERTLDGLVRK